VYIVDLRTGELQAPEGFPGWFQTKEHNAFMNSPVALDKGPNYSVDAVYVGASYPDADGIWRGTGYKLAVPITNGTYTEGPKASYELNPAKWKWSALFDAPAPLTAPFALSVDSRESVWIYAGTGRYMAYADKDPKSLTASQHNYLYGIKDPFYNSASPKKAACFHLYPGDVENLNCKLSTANLFNADPYQVKTGGAVEVLAGGDAAITSFDKLAEKVQTTDGWSRTLATTMPSERVLNKPALFGGIAFFPAFTPAADGCAYSGTSSLYALYFETGTAFSKAVLINSTNNQGAYSNETMDLGSGLASSFAVHAGKQDGGTLYLQQSTGVITKVDVIPANNVKSGPVYWKERR
jgi:type IV pilus assembly protein PilY1